MLRNLQDLTPIVRASVAEKRLLAGYLSKRPDLRQAMKKAPPAPLSWWDLLRQAKLNAGLYGGKETPSMGV